MKVLVTGGSGFLGSAICRDLIERGYAVRSATRTPAPELERQGIEDQRCDLADPAQVREVVQDCDAVIHTAAKVGIWGARNEFFRTNLSGTQHLIEESRRAGLKRFIYTSTPSVCFDGKGHRNADETLPYAKRHLAAYPESKMQAEKLVLKSNSSEFATCALRPHLIFGPDDPHLIPRLIERGRARKLIQVGTGANRVSMTWVDNAAGAHIDALEAFEDGGKHGGKAYFIAQEDPVCLWEWIGELFEELDVPPVKRKISRRFAYALGATLEASWNLLRKKSDPPMTRFVALQLACEHSYDMGPARRDFGYRERISMADATARLISAWGGRPPLQVGRVTDA